jgi:hypothetical protein
MRTTQTQAAVHRDLEGRPDPLWGGIRGQARGGHLRGGFEDFDVTLAAEDDTVHISGSTGTHRCRRAVRCGVPQTSAIRSPPEH